MITESNTLKELSETLNRLNAERGSNTPDFVLSNFLGDCLSALDEAINRRAQWYHRFDAPGAESDCAVLREQLEQARRRILDLEVAVERLERVHRGSLDYNIQLQREKEHLEQDLRHLRESSNVTLGEIELQRRLLQEERAKGKVQACEVEDLQTRLCRMQDLDKQVKSLSEEVRQLRDSNTQHKQRIKSLRTGVFCVGPAPGECDAE